MFESMPGSTTHEPNVFKFRMPVDQNISVRRVLILTNARFNNRRINKPRYPLCQILSHRLQSRRRDDALAAVGIELRSVCVDSHLQTTSIKIRHSVNEIVEVEPRRQSAAAEHSVSRRNAEKENLL